MPLIQSKIRRIFIAKNGQTSIPSFDKMDFYDFFAHCFLFKINLPVLAWVLELEVPDPHLNQAILN